METLRKIAIAVFCIAVSFLAGIGAYGTLHYGDYATFGTGIGTNVAVFKCPK